MSQSPTPRLILETLFPFLKVAAAYAHQIQSRIAAHPSKEADNFFAAALSDADLSIQTMMEVALLGSFPNIRFYGEEHEKTYNTKYFRSIELGPEGDYLVTLDPIDGTRFYLDGHSNYQIILTVLNWDEFEAVITLLPAQNTFIYALRGQGAFQGSLEGGLENAQPLQLGETKPTILLGWGLASLVPQLTDHYQVIDVTTHYSQEMQIPNFSGLMNGDLSGAVLRGGNFIDGAALAFIAQEMGFLVTDLAGNPPPPLHACTDYRRTGLLVAASPTVHQYLVEAVRKAAIGPAV
ncbi:MAG: inositol monophosphatase family protein [Leptolyngbyaceae cyanobacterium bins.59]|nr:inositol monophosphatase family protein [Leptolyngbyaceae cyanobacterium bins.59]